ncbi:hypothetical protein GCK32_002371 [Trichostrongylus colubriformis]|uniref:SCP domain-containing protein n=1 Tax=Trichostrongylus colubriformis TaxID=6319 RepID=A0AAN8FCI9_TRICO
MLTMTRPYATSNKIVSFVLLLFGYSLYSVKAQILDCFNDQLTSEDRHIFLDFHNAVRRRVAKGKQANVDEYLPTASNMYKMKWSCLLEAEIHERLSRCQSYRKKMDGFGMNIHEFSDFTPGYTPDFEFEETLNEWWSVMEEFKVAEPRTTDTVERFQKVANMLSASTTHIGCSYAFCQEVLYIGCMYHPNGTTQARIPYKTGPSCKHDSDCTTYRHSRCSDGLCIKGMAGRDVFYG